MAQIEAQPEKATTRETLPILRMASLDGANQFLRRNGLAPVRRGRVLLWDRAAVLALINEANKG